MVALPSYRTPIRPHADVVSEIDTPRWSGAVRCAVILVPSLALWAVIGAAVVVLLTCSAREAAYAASHPQPVAELAQ